MKVDALKTIIVNCHFMHTKMSNEVESEDKMRLRWLKITNKTCLKFKNKTRFLNRPRLFVSLCSVHKQLTARFRDH